MRRCGVCLIGRAQQQLTDEPVVAVIIDAIVRRRRGADGTEAPALWHDSAGSIVYEAPGRGRCSQADLIQLFASKSLGFLRFSGLLPPLITV
jgi:hypothetical protein